MPKGPRGEKRLSDLAGSAIACLIGAAVCFAGAWLNLGAHHWELGMSLIPFGVVLIVATVAMYRDRKRNA
jgi:hypothetical protein